MHEPIKKRVDIRNKIIEVARDIFFKRGFYDATTRAIAMGANTSESGVFRFFENKYHILMEVYNDAWGKVNERVTSSLSVSYSDPRNRLIEIQEQIWQMYQDDPITIAFIIMNTGNTDTLIIEKKESAYMTSENVKYIKMIEGLCNECVEKDLVSTLLTARSLTEGILGLSEGVLIGWYLLDKGVGSYSAKITVEQAKNLFKVLLYSKENI